MKVDYWESVVIRGQSEKIKLAALSTIKWTERNNQASCEKTVEIVQKAMGTLSQAVAVRLHSKETGYEKSTDNHFFERSIHGVW